MPNVIKAKLQNCIAIADYRIRNNKLRSKLSVIRLKRITFSGFSPYPHNISIKLDVICFVDPFLVLEHVAFEVFSKVTSEFKSPWCSDAFLKFRYISSDCSNKSRASSYCLFLRALMACASCSKWSPKSILSIRLSLNLTPNKFVFFKSQ